MAASPDNGRSVHLRGLWSQPRATSSPSTVTAVTVSRLHAIGAREGGFNLLSRPEERTDAGRRQPRRSRPKGTHHMRRGPRMAEPTHREEPHRRARWKAGVVSGVCV